MPVAASNGPTKLTAFSSMMHPLHGKWAADCLGVWVPVCYCVRSISVEWVGCAMSSEILGIHVAFFFLAVVGASPLWVTGGTTTRDAHALAGMGKGVAGAGGGLCFLQSSHPPGSRQGCLVRDNQPYDLARWTTGPGCCRCRPVQVQAADTRTHTQEREREPRWTVNRTGPTGANFLNARHLPLTSPPPSFDNFHPPFTLTLTLTFPIPLHTHSSLLELTHAHARPNSYPDCLLLTLYHHPVPSISAVVEDSLALPRSPRKRKERKKEKGQNGQASCTSNETNK